MNGLKKILALSFLIIAFSGCIERDHTQCVDVLIIGGSTSGVSAAIQSARMGVSVGLVEETPYLGGMLTAAGVSAIDGNYLLPSGIWGEFKQKLIDHYGSSEALKTGWVSNVLFEPSVGNKIFQDWIASYDNVRLFQETGVEDLIQKDGKWEVTLIQGKKKIQMSAKVLIDASELGDIAKMCGVKYDIGMDSRASTGEDIAPKEANDIVQDLTYVAILKDYGRDVSIEKPESYDPNIFACSCDNPICVSPKEPDRVWSKEMMISYGKLPNNKFMINWPIEGNDYYTNIVDATPDQRREAFQKAKDLTLCFLYFIQHELGYNTLGLADDEYDTPDRLPYIPYHRESRRIHGIVQFTLNDLVHPYEQDTKLYRTCIAVGDYPVDHHHNKYEGVEKLPDLGFYKIPSFGLPLGTLIPEDQEGLIVAEKSISVTNIVNGTTRLQPVVLQIGQAAGALAALAVKGDKAIRQVSVRQVQEALLEENVYLLPFLDVEQSDSKFKPYQRIGVTGILKGEGRSVEYRNEMWLRAEDPLYKKDLFGLSDVYPQLKDVVMQYGSEKMKISEAIELLREIATSENISFDQDKVSQIWSQFKLSHFDPSRTILRGEMAVLLDQLLHPFENKEVDFKGSFISNSSKSQESL